MSASGHLRSLIWPKLDNLELVEVAIADELRRLAIAPDECGRATASPDNEVPNPVRDVKHTVAKFDLWRFLDQHKRSKMTTIHSSSPVPERQENVRVNPKQGNPTNPVYFCPAAGRGS
jgi:hypothetical protein